MTNSLDEDMEITIKAVRGASEIILSYFNTDYEIRDKSPNNPVTAADLATDKFLKAELLGARPEYGWLSEEEIDDGSRHKAQRTWFVDPIDGTRAFIKGLPHFSISIALVENNQPILGVIYNPVTEELFTAIKGKGAFKNGLPIKASQTDTLENARMLGAAHMFHSKLWLREWPIMQINQRNSIAYRMALVASGEFDSAIATTTKNDWDLAAGALILIEAGGFATNHLGEPFAFNGNLKQRSLLACCQGLKNELLDRLAHIK
jgi:myo-inositol-1(or 4)-monophosphatase